MNEYIKCTVGFNTFRQKPSMTPRNSTCQWCTARARPTRPANRETKSGFVTTYTGRPTTAPTISRTTSTRELNNVATTELVCATAAPDVSPSQEWTTSKPSSTLVITANILIFTQSDRPVYIHHHISNFGGIFLSHSLEITVKPR